MKLSPANFPFLSTSKSTQSWVSAHEKGTLLPFLWFAYFLIIIEGLWEFGTASKINARACRCLQPRAASVDNGAR
jgi:hypothetical protein